MGIIIAIITVSASVLAIMINNIYSRKAELRKIKENHYVEFLSALAQARATSEENREQYNKVLSARIQTIYLIGSLQVQKALSEFLNILIEKLLLSQRIICISKIYVNCTL